MRADPFVIVPGKWTEVRFDPVRVADGQGELCGTVPSEYRLDESTWRIHTREARDVAVTARLVTPSGQTVDRVELGFISGERKQLCFLVYDRPNGEQYDRLQLTSTGRVVIENLRWRTGERRL